MAIKLLVCGYENTGKTTLVIKLKDTLIINCDRKVFNYNVPFAHVKDWTGLDNFKKEVNSKIKAYKDKYGDLPKWVVFDTITQLYAIMARFNNERYRGFEIHNQIDRDTLDINNYIENVLITNGINVIIVAHTLYDEASGRVIIPANGRFAKAGSWTSVCNEAIYIERNKEGHSVYFNSPIFPARTLCGSNDTDKMDIKDFDFYDYTEKLLNSNINNLDYEL